MMADLSRFAVLGTVYCGTLHGWQIGSISKNTTTLPQFCDVHERLDRLYFSVKRSCRQVRDWVSSHAQPTASCVSHLRAYAYGRRIPYEVLHATYTSYCAAPNIYRIVVSNNAPGNDGFMTGQSPRKKL